MPHRSNTVFIVEDDQSVRDALALLLGLQGLAVALFADAESFLAARRPDWYGCLLVDIRMPGMDGLTLQKRLRESGSWLPVIVMTGHGRRTGRRYRYGAPASRAAPRRRRRRPAARRRAKAPGSPPSPAG
jgi:FixJ family two-component response regulator